MKPSLMTSIMEACEEVMQEWLEEHQNQNEAPLMSAYAAGFLQGVIFMQAQRKLKGKKR